ncbi:hypothetical protein [Mycolicibacterium canariasense]|uniref:hypothetical protein n=1 Tax=Mycolicibacterium canariasense TaxID=228230 RepID=UPI000A169B8A|nr:hypothetical protein [Mycolicibacterium canariasense]MCV7208416.1 hypothetical protein [Mycolicibacterium canariasense]ORV13594.1 hypothetical protein AWB94_05090 [Mycolicibacterium canariasense]
MSSFELLELFGVTIDEDHENEVRTVTVEFAPEDGAVADALRDGERPEWKQMLAQIANIAALFRSGKFPRAEHEEYGERTFLPVKRIKQIIADRQAVEAGGGLIMFPGEG